MITDVKELEKYPDIMSKDQFQKACHLSCRKAYWLLNSGLLPCERTGKKTRCYKIKKADVIKFVEDYLVNPLIFVMPASAEKRVRKTEEEYLCLTGIPKARIKNFYRANLSKEPEVLTAKRIGVLTGYSDRTIRAWQNRGDLKCLSRHLRPLRFTKESLINILASDHYNNKHRKSEVHIRMIKEIKRKYEAEK